MHTNSFVDSSVTRGILNVDVSDHFSVSLVDKSSQIDSSKKDTFVTRRDFSCKNIAEFKKLSREVNWILHNVNHAHDRLLEIFTGLYNIAFPKRKLRIKQKL